MLLSTQLELNITIKDINAIYSTDYETMLLDHARIMYEGKCYNNQYIKSIDQLVKRSLPNVIRRDLVSKIRVYIIVNVTAIRYDQYDTITNMKVNKIIPYGKIADWDMLECSNDHVTALIKMKKGNHLFKQGNKIPIVVGQSLYKVERAHILVNAFPFIPRIHDSVAYNIAKPTEKEKEYYMTFLVPLVQKELNQKESLDQKRWKFFSDLLYPYKTKPVKTGSIDILTQIPENGVFMVDQKTNLSDLKLTVGDGDVLIIADPITSFNKMIFQFIKHIQVINDLAIQYEDDEIFNEHQYIWDLYENHKKE